MVLGAPPPGRGPPALQLLHSRTVSGADSFGNPRISSAQSPSWQWCCPENPGECPASTSFSNYALRTRGQLCTPCPQSERARAQSHGDSSSKVSSSRKLPTTSRGSPRRQALGQVVVTHSLWPGQSTCWPPCSTK